jgi:tetratricopeptide (TPR) repeat protein
MVEVFPTVDSFSVRTAGMMGAETFGASFGPVITAVAPRSGQTLGEFNWARVLRHEFTHVMNMAATQGRVPRWLTEGLAVWQEHVAYRFEWVPPALYAAATDDKLFPLATLDDAFYRPRNSTDGEVAYMEGFWIVEYLRETFGPHSVIKLLDAFKSGLRERDAYPAATGQSIEQVQSDFFAWAKRRVSAWGYDKETSAKYKVLADEGDALLRARQDAQAAEKWEAALALQPMNPQPHRRLAGLYLRMRQPAKAIPHLEALVPLELKDNRYPKRISQLYRDLGKIQDAIRFAREALEIDPYDISAHELLAELYTQSGNADAAAKERKTIEFLQTRPAKSATSQSG